MATVTAQQQACELARLHEKLRRAGIDGSSYYFTPYEKFYFKMQLTKWRSHITAVISHDITKAELTRQRIALLQPVALSDPPFRGEESWENSSYNTESARLMKKLARAIAKGDEGI